MNKLLAIALFLSTLPVNANAEKRFSEAWRKQIDTFENGFQMGKVYGFLVTTCSLFNGGLMSIPATKGYIKDGIIEMQQGLEVYVPEKTLAEYLKEETPCPKYLFPIYD